MPHVTAEEEEKSLRKRLRTRVRTLRRAAGLTLAAASARAEMHWRHWQKIETGHVNVTMQTLVRVAHALRVDVSDLFSGPEPTEGGAEPATMQAR
jgi:transcriptional regulator with XRE-family HTH domain